MANTTSKQNSTTSIIREEDLDEMEQFQRDLEEKIERARDDKRLYMMAQYVGLLAKVKTEVKRIRNRFDRETLANHRRAQRELRELSRPATHDASTARSEA